MKKKSTVFQGYGFGNKLLLVTGRDLPKTAVGDAKKFGWEAKDASVNSANVCDEQQDSDD